MGNMLTIEDAVELVRQRVEPLPSAVSPVGEALGLVLAEDVVSDVDSPPHDKAMVDGYAIVAADLAGGEAMLTVLEEVTAGDLPRRAVVPGTATRIMTGAPLPDGADAVVMVERSELSNGGRQVRLRDRPPSVGQNILRRAAAFGRGQTVLSAGATVRPIEVGLLSEAGRTMVSIIRRPIVAVLATGNELVPAEVVPAAGQLRNSNSPMLCAAAARAGAVVRDLGIARDERDALRGHISAGLTADVLLLSGGVSAGVLDLVPGALLALGVEEVFHKIRLKPGKPLWFGVRPRDGLPVTLVFGLPGNPVGSLVCFELFVRPAVARLAGKAFAGAPRLPARLTQTFTHRGDRATYHPAVLRTDQDGCTVEPLSWRGSADLATVARATALACFPPGERSYQPGETIDVVPLE